MSQGPLGVVELFAGLGSVATGFAATGRFEPLLLTDVDPIARDTYRENFPDGASYLCEDVRLLTPRRILEEVAGRSVSGLLGCPPCQGFSSAGKRDVEDPNNGLLRDFFAIARRLHVQFFVMENVPAVLNQRVFETQLETTRKSYRIWKGVLNSAMYGLPQTRQRCIVIGYHRDLGVAPTPPSPTHFGERAVFNYGKGAAEVPTVAAADEILGTYPRLTARRRNQGWCIPSNAAELKDLVTVSEALNDLPPQPCSDGHRVLDRPMSGYAMRLATPDHEVFNHQGWRHTSEMIERMRVVSEGGVPSGGDGWAVRNGRYYSQAYGRLHRRGLARTVTTNFHNPGSGRFTHYRVPRTLTIREAARLQGFPDSFRFIRYQSWQERLIGNAFPPLWAQKIAAHVWDEVGSLIAGGVPQRS